MIVLDYSVHDAGIEEGIQRPEMIAYIVKNITTPLVLWGVNEFEAHIVHPDVQYERRFFLSMWFTIR